MSRGARRALATGVAAVVGGLLTPTMGEAVVARPESPQAASALRALFAGGGGALGAIAAQRLGRAG